MEVLVNLLTFIAHMDHYRVLGRIATRFLTTLPLLCRFSGVVVVNSGVVVVNSGVVVGGGGGGRSFLGLRFFRHSFSSHALSSVNSISF